MSQVDISGMALMMNKAISAPRKRSGNMLLLTMISGLVMVGTIFLMFIFLFPQMMKGMMQNSAEALALKTAKALNAQDQSGRMNNIVARCRELVFTSRETYNRVNSLGYKHLEPLSRQLLNEARNNAQMLDDQRELLLQENVKSALKEAETAEFSIKGQKEFSLPGMTAQAPKLTNMDLGYIKGVQSNVEVSAGNPALIQYDKDHDFIQESSNLYVSNIDARLPDADSDLQFKMFPLPAPVRGNVAPARLTAPTVFVSCGQVIKNGKPNKVKIEQLPSAVKLEYVSQVGTKATATQGVKIVTCAAADGASVQP